MRFLAAFIVVVAFSAGLGYQFYLLQGLRNNLGEIQYAGQDPKLRIEISNVEFEPVDPKSYKSPKVSYRANLLTTSDSFELGEFQVSLYFKVLGADGDEVSSFIVTEKVKNGVLSIAETARLYGVSDADNLAGMAGYTLAVDFYQWYPIREFKPAN